MKINTGLFELSDLEKQTCLSLYGKIIKCIVAPYHSYIDLEKIVPWTNNTFLYPERELSYFQTRTFIGDLVRSSHKECLIITSSISIILNLFDGCIRILTQGNDLVKCHTKTFAANIHSIRHEVLENTDHHIEKETLSYTLIQSIIDDIRNRDSITNKEYDNLKSKIKLIGEPIISNRLSDMLNDIKITPIS